MSLQRDRIMELAEHEQRVMRSLPDDVRGVQTTRELVQPGGGRASGGRRAYDVFAVRVQLVAGGFGGSQTAPCTYTYDCWDWTTTSPTTSNRIGTGLSPRQRRMAIGTHEFVASVFPNYGLGRGYYDSSGTFVLCDVLDERLIPDSCDTRSTS